MKSTDAWIVFAVLAAGTAAMAVVFWPEIRAIATGPASPAQAPTTQAPVSKGASAPQFRFPLPGAAQAPSLPELAQSDSLARKVLAELFGRSTFESFFSQTDIVRRIVATVDNLPRERVAQRLLPVHAARGPMLVAGAGEQRSISPQNAARYQPFVAIAEAVDTKVLVAAYIRHYPLFQQAYRELGYPSGYFNDRLIEVIDHLLAAPEVDAPLQLVQRKVLYEFADPELEARSAGQKIMFRIGAANAARVRSKLRDLRGELTAAAPRS